jgi:PASTA domain
MRRGVLSVLLACLAMAVLPLAAHAANVSLSLTSPSPILTSSGIANVQFDVNVDTVGCDPTKSFYIQIVIHNSAGQNAASSGPLYNDTGGPHSYIVTLPQGQKSAAYRAQATLYCPDTSTPARQLAVDSVVVSFTVTRTGAGGSGGGGGGSGGGGGGSGSGGGGVHCVVPKLVGKTLTRAKKLLGHAHCALGKVTAPKVAGGTKLVVRSSSPKAGTRLPKGAKVNVRLRRS